MQYLHPLILKTFQEVYFSVLLAKRGFIDDSKDSSNGESSSSIENPGPITNHNHEKLLRKRELLLGELRIICDPKEIYAESLNLGMSSHDEILIATTSEDTILRNLDFFGTISSIFIRHSTDTAGDQQQAVKNEVGGEKNGKKPRMRLLVPVSRKEPFERISRALKGLEWRAMDPMNGITFGVFDRRTAIIYQYNDNHADTPERALSSALLTTNPHTVLGLVSLFDALWRTTDLIRREERSRERARAAASQARMWQDILTNDFGNYVQISKLSAELLRERLKQDKVAHDVLSILLSSVDHAIESLEKARKLSGILSTEVTQLVPKELLPVINSSLNGVRRQFASREIVVNDIATEVSSMSPILVLADDLLEDVFTNLFANCVESADDRKVTITIRIHEGNVELDHHDKNHYHILEDESFGQESKPQEPAHESGEDAKEKLRPQYWKISITDRGRRIGDETKREVFPRYLSDSRGAGLGMSIVHALVVGRYRGAIRILNRVPDDHTQGTTIEISLQKAN